MKDDAKVREQLGVTPFNQPQRDLIQEVQQHITPDFFRNALSGNHFLIAAIDIYLQLDQAKGKRKELNIIKEMLFKNIHLD